MGKEISIIWLLLLVSIAPLVHYSTKNTGYSFFGSKKIERTMKIRDDGSVGVDSVYRGVTQDNIPLFHGGNESVKLEVKYRQEDRLDGRSWTFMVYLDADNNLEEVGLDDFWETSSIGSTSDVAILVLMDRIPGYSDDYGDWTGTNLFYVCLLYTSPSPRDRG